MRHRPGGMRPPPVLTLPVAQLQGDGIDERDPAVWVAGHDCGRTRRPGRFNVECSRCKSGHRRLRFVERTARDAGDVYNDVSSRRPADVHGDGARLADEPDREQHGDGDGRHWIQLRVRDRTRANLYLVARGTEVGPGGRSVSGTAVWSGNGVYTVTYTPTTKYLGCTLTVKVRCHQRRVGRAGE